MIIPDLSSSHNAYLETTQSEHEHGGEGWEFGTCLWSPLKNAGGANSYRILTEPKEGDLVLHNYNYSPDGKSSKQYICGKSIISIPAYIVNNEPPKAGRWIGRGQYYRIDLKDFTYFDNPLESKIISMNYAEQFREEIELSSPLFYPFAIREGVVRFNQGMYLTKLTPKVLNLFSEILGIENRDLSASEKKAVHQNYADGERQKRETTFFSRNPKLAAEVKLKYNHTCQICGFSPLKLYGNKYVNAGIECHHLDALSERRNYSGNSTVEDVTVLCANCHRLVHSRRPTLTIAKAKTLFRLKPYTLGNNL